MNADPGKPTVTTWFLEQTAPDDLREARPPEPSADVSVVRAQVPSADFSRFLYSSVGADVEWTDRLAWTYARWREWLERPGVETWVAYERGTPAGYIELDGATPDTSGRAIRPGRSVEISYFGLLPAFRGRRIGGHLLGFGTARAWDLARRWPDRQPTNRVWLHTCSKDGPHALRNYQRRGFRIFAKEVAQEPAPAPVEQDADPAAPAVPGPGRPEPSQGSRPAEM
ncbi:GNAT family N-acetyltransferase [Streptomyces ovatisporus]|uniref:GNAT family N-acetyltransferase n=1 Tax=Streptomyces ovatisporus TaxID=1128682 RepID=A0ABV9ABG9_9ACTN